MPVLPMNGMGPSIPGEICLVNEFDPNWGQPPGTYQNIPMRFDPDIGAYRWDLPYALANLPSGYVVGYAYWSEVIPARYADGWLLQPYKSPGSDAWQFRWILNQRKVTCTPLGGGDRTVSQLDALASGASMRG